jgi:putative endopeptidase
MSRIALVLILVLAAATANAQSASTASTVHPPVLDVTSIDSSVDPCTDFFAYSCGGWLKKNPIPPDKTSWSAAWKLQDDNKVLLRGILEEASEGGASRDSVKQKIGDYYAACMDEKIVEAAGANPLQAVLERISGMHSKRDMARVAAGMLGDGVCSTSSLTRISRTPPRSSRR